MLIRMYISKPNKFNLTQAMQQDVNSLEFVMATEFGGYTQTRDATGAWVSGDTLHMDVTDVYEILITNYDAKHEAKIIEFIKNFGNIYGQECLPFAVIGSHNQFVEIK